ncbi:hypothetical protein [Nocardioides pacificus]
MTHTLTVVSPLLPGTVVDGDPHLAYCDKPSGLSFVWTGDLAEPIHVQHGGYGEPTIALIDPAPLYPGGHETPAEVLAWFARTCERWNQAWDGVSGTIAEHQVTGRCSNRLAGGPLVCDNTDPRHLPGHGCTDAATTGSWRNGDDHEGGLG